MDDDAIRWDQRYDGQPLAEPTPPDALVAAGLTDVIPEVGRALDVACGSGGQSLWLAARGLDVVAVDVSPKAVALTTAAAAEHGWGDRIAAHVIDLDDGIPDRLGSFDVLVCQRFRATHLYSSLAARLLPHGIGVITVLSVEGATDPGPFHAPAGELASAFEACEVLAHHLGDGQESIVIRRR